MNLSRKIYVDSTEKKGRGIFAKEKIQKGEIIEKCPVVELSSEERSKIDETKLYDYYFSWGQDEGKAAIALGFGSLYNHSFDPNTDYKKDLENQQIIFKALKSIDKGEEVLVDYTKGGDEEDLWFESRSFQQ